MLESERGGNLSLRRFSPLDYSLKLSGPVECPFEGCNFQADLGKTMINHQQEVRHPAWNRHDTTREGQSMPWHCGLRTCQKAFPTWDGFYKHMQSTTSLWHVLFAKVTGQTKCQGLENTLKTCMAKKHRKRPLLEEEWK